MLVGVLDRVRAFGAEAVVVSLGLDILGGDLEASGMSTWMWSLKAWLFCNTAVQAAVFEELARAA